MLPQQLAHLIYALQKAGIPAGSLGPLFNTGPGLMEPPGLPGGVGQKAASALAGGGLAGSQAGSQMNLPPREMPGAVMASQNMTAPGGRLPIGFENVVPHQQQLDYPPGQSKLGTKMFRKEDRAGGRGTSVGQAVGNPTKSGSHAKVYGAQS
jgi:hypothetical protein